MATIRELFVRMGVDASAVGKGVTETVQQLGRMGSFIDKTTQQVQSAARQQVQASQLTADEVTRSAARYDAMYTKQGQAAAKAAETEVAANERRAASGQNLSRRMNSVSVGVLFAFDAMTRGAQAGEGAWRRVFRSMSLLALVAFDPPAGIIVAGILAATDAIVDAFGRQERAIEKATRTFISNSIEIARANDMIRASMQQQAVFSGDPFAIRGQGKDFLTGEDVSKDETAEAFRIRHEGLQGAIALQRTLNAELEKARALMTPAQKSQAQTLADFGNLQQFGVIRKTLDPAVAAAADLVTKVREVNALALEYAQFNSRSEQTLQLTVKHTQELAAGMQRIWADSKVPKDLANEAEQLVSIYNDLNKRHEATVPLAQAVLSAYDKLTAQLDRLRAAGKGVMDPVVQSLLKAKDAFEKTGIIEMLRLGRIPSPGAVGQTPTIPQGPLSTTPAAMPDSLIQRIIQVSRFVSLGDRGTALQTPTGISPADFAANVPMQEAERIRESLLDILSRGTIQPATGFGGGALSVAPRTGALTQLDVIVQTIKDKFTGALAGFGTTMNATLISTFGPIAVLMRAMEPAIRTLTPLFDRLAVPIAIVAQVLVASLLPVLRAIYPIIRALGIAATLVGEVMARVSAAIAQAVGGLIKAIGNLIAKIPGLGGVGRSIARFGQSILTFAEGQKQAANQFAAARRELMNMSWDDTAQALDNLQGAAQNAADALTNIPTGFRIQRAIFLASRPVNAADDFGVGPNSSSSGATNYFAPGSIVIVGSTKTGQQLLDEVSTAARRTAMARTGSTADAPSVIG